MLELPKRDDYHQTTIVDLNPAYTRGEILKKDDLIHYRKGFINLRNIIDVFENSTPFDVIDEEKYDNFVREMEAWEEENKGQPKRFYAGIPEDNFQGLPTMQDANRPQLPLKKFIVKTTNILYMNGIQRAMTDDLEEFQELYFNYLQRQKLDID